LKERKGILDLGYHFIS